MDVLALKLKVSGAKGIKSSRERDFNIFTGPGEARASGGSLAAFGAAHELRLNKPVVDHTGLKGVYDFSVHWTPSRDSAEDVSRMKQAFLDQLGLEFVPAREQVEVLVVERASN